MVYLVYASQVKIHQWEKSRQELKAGIFRQVLKPKPRGNAAHWFAPDRLLNLLSYSTQDHLLSCGTSQSWLEPPTWIIVQENCPHIFSKPYQIFLNGAPSSQMTKSLCQIDKNEAFIWTPIYTDLHLSTTYFLSSVYLSSIIYLVSTINTIFPCFNNCDTCIGYWLFRRKGFL